MNTQRKPLKTLTVKQTKLVQGIAEGKTKRQAATDAGYTGTPETISAVASETLSKPNVQDALVAAFEKHGINIDTAVKPVADGLIATRSVGIGEDAFEVADHSTRLKAAGMAFGLMGIGKQSGDVTINFINASSEQHGIYDL